jgi:hypothetical protein
MPFGLAWSTWRHDPQDAIVGRGLDRVGDHVGGRAIERRKVP